MLVMPDLCVVSAHRAEARDREGSDDADLSEIINNMKTEYMKVFAGRVAQKIKQAESMGSKTTWTTQDHLDALATLITDAVGESEISTIRKMSVLDILKECYNVSAFTQMLAKEPTFKAAGHFQRGERATLDSTIAQLVAAQNTQGGAL